MQSALSQQRGKNKSVNNKQNSKITPSNANDSIIVESVRESENMTEAGPAIQLNASIAPIDSGKRNASQGQMKIEAKDMFPKLHQKTFYRAAMEYSLGSVEKPTHRPTKDTDEFIDGHVVKAQNAVMRKNKYTIMQRTKSQSRTLKNASQQTISKGGKSFSLADMTTDAQLKRYTQLNQLQAHKSFLPQS